MKLLHVLSTPRAEGTPNIVLDWLATGLHTQEVFVLNRTPADLTDRISAAAAWYDEREFFSLGKRKFFEIRDGVTKVCQDRKPDVVLCWPTGFANWVCWGARRAGVDKLLVHAGNPPTRGFIADWGNRYCLWPMRMAGAEIICCSQYVRDGLADIPLVSKNNLHAIWNCARVEGVYQRAEATRQLRPSPETPTAIMVATLERHKDHETMLKAVPLIRARLPKFQLKLAGDGSLRSKLTSLASDLGIHDCVEFLGMRRDVPELLGTVDLFVLATTDQEGLGTVMIEALAAGVPVIASDVPACHELLCGGEQGTLVKPHCPKSLADAVISFFVHRTNDRQKGIEFASQFTPERMFEAYLSVLSNKR